MDPVDLPGPWTHRRVAANGARFHVALSEPAGDPLGEAPLVVLLHGFPQLWWAWRHQLPALAAAGYRTAALDLRGYGGSDKTPNGYDPQTLAADVDGVIGALGASRATLVGHGWGGYVAWATALQHPGQVAGLATLAAPHPATLMRRLRTRGGRRALRHLLRMQAPVVPERRLADPASGMLAEHLLAWSGTTFPSPEELSAYQSAFSVWPSAHCALEYHRWLLRSRLRADGRAFSAAMRAEVAVPVLEVYGGRDPVVTPPRHPRAPAGVTGAYDVRTVPASGHFLPEEAPAEVTDLLLGWLGTLRHIPGC